MFKKLIFVLLVGLALYIGIQEPESKQISYTISAGETVWGALGNYCSSKDDITYFRDRTAEVNRGINLGRIQPGQKIILVVPK